MKNKNSLLLGGALFTLGAMLTSCSSSSDSGGAGALSDQLTQAQSYLSDSLPNLENSVGFYASSPLRTDRLNFSPLSINLITPTDWANPSVMINPPGGSVGGSEPTYDGAAMPSTVYYRDYMKMALDKDFYRYSSSGNFRPTVFGRLDNIILVMQYTSQANMPSDANGLPNVGTHELTLTLEGQGTVNVYAKVEATTSTTYYDRKMYLVGYSDSNSNGSYDSSTDTTLFTNLMWMKANTTQLNMMMLELQDRVGSDDVNDVFTATVLNWNRSTGAFNFEYATNPDDSSGSGFETYRVLIESTGGKAWVYGLQANNGAEGTTTNPYMQWALYTPSISSTEGTLSLRNRRSNADMWLGNICITFASGVGDAGIDWLDGDYASGGTCSGQASDAINTKAGLMGAGDTLFRSYTTWTDAASNKGFPAVSYPNWNSEEAIAAWLTAGESITTSFNTRTGFISRWSSEP